MLLYINYLIAFIPLNAQLIPIHHLLALLGAHHIFHVSRIRVNCNYLIKYCVRLYNYVHSLLRYSLVCTKAADFVCWVQLMKMG